MLLDISDTGCERPVGAEESLCLPTIKKPYAGLNRQLESA